MKKSPSKILSKSFSRESFRPTWLGAVPVASAALVALLMIPRRAALENVPLPTVDQREITAVEATDDELSRRTIFPDDVRFLGTLVRRFHTLDVEHEVASKSVAPARTPDEIVDEVAKLRMEIDRVVSALLTPGRLQDLRALRAVQERIFLTELARFESEGKESQELSEIAGSFVVRMRDVGWCVGNHILLGESERRVAYKNSWNTIVGVSERSDFRLTLDELRVQTRFEMLYPTQGPRLRGAAESLRTAGKPKEAEAYVAHAFDVYRLERVERLAKIDATYPTSLAKMILQTRLHRTDMAKESYYARIESNPEGDYSLRTRNLLLTIRHEESPE